MKNRSVKSMLLVAAAAAIVLVTLGYSQHLASIIRQEEQRKVELWVEAVKQRAELVTYTQKLFEELGLNKREAKEIVEAFFEEIRLSLESNEQVKISGFGNFDLRDKSSRPGRNPKTGQDIPISARRVVTFKPGQKLKARVETYAGPDGDL